MATLRTILNGALEDGLIAANPAVRLGRFIVRTDGDTEHGPDPFTAEEVRALLDATERDWPEWHVFFLTMARTGLRVGECLSLHRMISTWSEAPCGCGAPGPVAGSGARRASAAVPWT